MPDVLSFFPHQEFRSFQREAIEDIQKAFDEGHKYVILESPTGSGKSAMAVSLGLFNQPGFLLTSQKILQEQYIQDYGSDNICVMKGRNNYTCHFWRGDASCAEGVCQSGKPCEYRGTCEYNIAKRQAIQSKLALMNYSYYLNAMEYTDNFPSREILICDEAHNIESECMKFVEFSFSTLNLSKLGVTSKIPQYKTLDQYVVWVESILEKVQVMARKLSSMINTYEVNDNDPMSQDRLSKMQKEYDSLMTQQEKAMKFLTSYKSTEWIFDIVKSEKLNRTAVHFKPLTIAYFANPLIFQYANKSLLMSATILDKTNFCRTLGIEQDAAKFMRLPSTFDPEIRPVIITNTGSMGKGAIDGTLPKIAADVERMLKHHPDEKGLIHTHTYKIANFLRDNVDPELAERFIFHSSEDRQQMLIRFIKSKEPKVLVTPSMTEGIDLKDDLARFVVIVKIPYLFLGDKQVKRRMEMDEEWYRWRAALSLVQAAGRGVRHTDDYCVIYIMDSGIRYFFKKNRKFFPDYFIESIKN